MGIVVIGPDLYCLNAVMVSSTFTQALYLELPVLYWNSSILCYFYLLHYKPEENNVLLRHYI